MNQENDPDNGRFTVLETKLAYQELTIKELGALVYDQGREISRMATLLKLLGDRLKNLDAGSGQPMAASERPPHY